MSGNGTGPKACSTPTTGIITKYEDFVSQGALRWRYWAMPGAWTTIETATTKIVYMKEQSFIHKHNLDDVSFNKLDQITEMDAI